MSVTGGVRLDLSGMLARELAATDGETWGLLDLRQQDRYRELADSALHWDGWNLRPVTPYRPGAPAEGLTVARVEAAVRKIVGAKPLGKWLAQELRDELERSTP